MACQSDAACVAQSAAYPYCTPFGCSECRTTSDCPGSKPICRGACFQCMYPSDCTNPAAGCNSSTFTCGSCEVAADCPSGVCNGGTCQ
jgi:hypothetical protein